MKLYSKRTLTLVLLALLCVALAVRAQDVQQEQEHQQEDGAEAAQALEASITDHEQQHMVDQRATEQEVSEWEEREGSATGDFRTMRVFLLPAI